jgi:hypothetical protein
VPGIVVNSTTQLNGTTPTINVRELQKGSNSTITSIGGFINVIVSNITGYGTVSSRSFSTSILEDSLSSIFFDLGMGETRIIQIVDNDQKTIFWDIEFHEIPQMYFDNEYIKFSSEALNDEVNMTVTFERIQPSQSGCCMSPDSGSFSIWNSRENKISQFTLNSRSSSIDVLRVLVDLTSLKSDCIDIKQYDRPSFGRSWLIEFIADGKCFPLLSNDTLNIIENLEVFSINPFDVPNTGSGILNSHPAVWSTIDHPRLPECQRLILKGNNLLETTFILQLGNFSTRFLDGHISIERFEDELRHAFHLDAIHITPVEDRLSIAGDYRMWDIHFISIAGNVPPLSCDTNSTSLLNSHFEVTNQVEDTSLCTVIDDFRNATSKEISGSYFLTYNGSVSSTIESNSSAYDVEEIIENLLNENVMVTKK